MRDFPVILMRGTIFSSFFTEHFAEGGKIAIHATRSLCCQKSENIMAIEVLLARKEDGKHTRKRREQLARVFSRRKK